MELNEITIYNCPTYAYYRKYIVATEDQETHKLWFYGAWDDLEKAQMSIERDSDKHIFETADVSGGMTQWC